MHDSIPLVLHPSHPRSAFCWPVSCHCSYYESIPQAQSGSTPPFSHATASMGHCPSGWRLGRSFHLAVHSKINVSMLGIRIAIWSVIRGSRAGWPELEQTAVLASTNIVSLTGSPLVQDIRQMAVWWGSSGLGPRCVALHYEPM
jgi:hypothetical protein